MFRGPHFGRAAVIGALFAISVPVVASVAAAAESWLSGPALDERLHSITSVSWSHTPLSQALASLRGAQHVAIVLDRRIDPEREVRLDLPREPLEDVLRKVALQLQLGYSQLGPVAYFGPPLTARRLRTLAALRTEEARSLDSPAARKLLERQACHWDDLAEPRAILQSWAAQRGVKVAGAEKIPHDLWPAADLPALSWIERVTLLTAQFDLTFHIEPDGKRIELVRIPAKVALARTYRIAGPTEATAKRFASEFPEIAISEDDGKLHVEGLLEDHELIARRLRGAPPRRTTTTAGKEVYQVSIENVPLSRVAEQLAQRLNLEFKWDTPAIDKAGIAVDQLISIRVENADVDDLLGALFRGTNLRFERVDGVVNVRPATASDKP